jgi:outer membrane receptor protein involved in Fe transport
LQTIIVNKTSQPDMLGDAIGGTIDFRTPSAFDYADDRASVTVGGRMESRARAYGQNGLGWNAGADYARKFGADHQFGLYVSGFYDIRHFANSLVGGVQESGCCDNGYDFAVQDAAGNSAPGLDPPLQPDPDGGQLRPVERLYRTLWRQRHVRLAPDADTSIYLRASYARAKTDQNSQLTQIVGGGKLDGSSGTALGNGTYAPVIGNVQARFWYETNLAIATLGTVQLGMDKHAGRLTVSPSLFYSWQQCPPEPHRSGWPLCRRCLWRVHAVRL